MRRTQDQQSALNKSSYRSSNPVVVGPQFQRAGRKSRELLLFPVWQFVWRVAGSAGGQPVLACGGVFCHHVTYPGTRISPGLRQAIIIILRKVAIDALRKHRHQARSLADLQRPGFVLDVCLLWSSLASVSSCV